MNRVVCQADQTVALLALTITAARNIQGSVGSRVVGDNADCLCDPASCENDI